MTTFSTAGRYLEIDGANIYFEQVGDKNNPPLILLHGGFQDMKDMDELVSWFSDKFHVITIDSRGHGRSTLTNGELTYARIQQDVESVLEHLGIDSVSIIGFSDGGIVGYRMAAAKRINIEKLVAIGSSWQNSDIEESEEIYRSMTPESAMEMFADNYARYMNLNPEPDFEQFVSSVLSMWLDKTETGHPNEMVDQITAPTLLIRGDGDFLVSAESLIALKNRISGSAFFNVPFAEHVVYQEQPQAVKIILDQFLD